MELQVGTKIKKSLLTYYFINKTLDLTLNGISLLLITGKMPVGSKGGSKKWTVPKVCLQRLYGDDMLTPEEIITFYIERDHLCFCENWINLRS